MATIVKNSKKFKIIKVSVFEVRESFGGLGICDWCNDSFDESYYIPVLDHCYCEECYNNWMERAKNFKSDRPFENKMFKLRKEQLEI